MFSRRVTKPAHTPLRDETRESTQERARIHRSSELTSHSDKLVDRAAFARTIRSGSADRRGTTARKNVDDPIARHGEGTDEAGRTYPACPKGGIGDRHRSGQLLTAQEAVTINDPAAESANDQSTRHVEGLGDLVVISLRRHERFRDVDHSRHVSL